MVALSSLWLPIVLSAVVVFVASSIIHLVLTYHRSNYSKLPDEDQALAAMRQVGIGPGNYYFPHATSPKAMGSPEMIEKYKKGPVGIMHVAPNGPPAMPKHLAIWFVFCLLVSLFAGYLAAATLAPGSAYLAVFRVVGTAAFMAYGLSELQSSIWKIQKWSTTWKHLIDGLVYGLLTAGVFGWLWPA